ncbi:MAG TPA: 1,4-dihydroxy-2-naphthoate polyprenyltransferase [Acidimicrobiales bacterium]|nr:1,4-dihydroxy-2-naphthoate polyprenyltransferase [Acidimicrobiales bacterium]
MASAAEWVAAARPRTLPASISPVAVGVGVAAAAGPVSWWRALLTLLVSLSVQVGTNYANDYSDGVRGTDAVRSGPARLVASGRATPAAVKRAAFATFGFGALCGLAVALSRSPWLVLVGAACIAAGWFYTGGSHPYGYAGLGELFVFVFFGLVGVVGSTYAASGHLYALAFLASLPVGLLTVAILVVNNLRDIPTDADVGKRTLAVRIGAPATRALYLALIACSFALLATIAPRRPASLIALAAVLTAVAPTRAVRSGATGRALIPALGETGRLELLFSALLAIGIAL